jgi:hypothetical protein
MTKFDRRGFIRIGSISAFGLLPFGEFLRLRAQNPVGTGGTKQEPGDISVIHLLLAGGMSHLDTFDMKPDGNPKFRSPFKQIPTVVPGLQVCEHLPLTGRKADKYLVIRSMTHKSANHDVAMNMIMTGHEMLPTVEQPSVGSVVAKELGPRNELPPYVSIPSPPGNWGTRAGFLGPKFNAFNTGEVNVPNFAVRDLDLPIGLDWGRMQKRHALMSLVDSRIRAWDNTKTFDTMDAYYRSAFELMQSPRAKKAFDVAQEPESVRETYGRTTMGQGCLLARRLVEAGVRFITVSRGFNAWDHHANIFPALANDFLPELDRAFSALIEDLLQRGMLDTTLVLLTGEFGRTPEINVNGGRDHWPNCFTLCIAGAGVPGGSVWGASDKDGMFVADRPVEIPDFIASIYHKLGIDHTKEYVSNIGRPIKLAGDGEPLHFL